MSKKDYIAIANALKHSTKTVMPVPVHFMLRVAENLIHVFKCDNALFDENRFREYLKSDKQYKDFTNR